MSRKNLLIVRAGDTSLHPTWLRGARQRNFDLLVSYYGATPGKYRADAEHYHEMTGPRWPAHDAICCEQAALIAQYDYVCFACDDLGANARRWNRLFDLCRTYALDLAQPAVTGYTSYQITRPHRGCILRYTNFVEVMCPVMSRAALRVIGPTFGESVSGWGLGYAWWTLLKGPARIAVIDSVSVRHGRKVGEGTLYGVLKGLGVDAGEEMERLHKAYDKQDFTPAETGREMKWPHAAVRRLAPGLYRK